MAVLQTEIFNFLAKWESNEARENYKTGASISYTMDYLKDKGWNKLGSKFDFINTVEKLGFEIKPARTKNGFHKSTLIVSI